jgi:hypothetical protein
MHQLRTQCPNSQPSNFTEFPDAGLPRSNHQRWQSGTIEQDFGGSEQDPEHHALVITTNKEEAFKFRVELCVRVWVSGWAQL